MRIHTRSGRPSRPSHTDPDHLKGESPASFGSWWDHFLVRVIFGAACVIAGYHFRPFGLQAWSAALVGSLFAVSVFMFEVRLQRMSLQRLIGAAVGSILGILGTSVDGFGVGAEFHPRGLAIISGCRPASVDDLHWVGSGDRQRRYVESAGDGWAVWSGATQPAPAQDSGHQRYHRWAGWPTFARPTFSASTLLVPKFVLRELQLVADSADNLSSVNAGGGSLEILQRIQQMTHLDVQITDDDFPQIAEVDLKLIELAKRHDAEIVTNDYNLNKVATLQGLDVLNVNQLANALKPVVLPGETMRVFILREGKEHNQGVAYLNDGTMVVVDGGRRMINKTVDITVTSVHQTTAGKMIFGRLDDRAEAVRHAPASGADPFARGVGETTSSERLPRTVVPEPSES